MTQRGAERPQEARDCSLGYAAASPAVSGRCGAEQVVAMQHYGPPCPCGCPQVWVGGGAGWACVHCDLNIRRS